jgi:hypothetical protein
MSNQKYYYYVKFYDHYPPEIRKFIETKDHRYIMLFDPKNSPYKLYDEETKKSIY